MTVATAAILANLALANTIGNVNLAQQNALAATQAMNQLFVALVAKAGETILTAKTGGKGEPQGLDLAALVELIGTMNSKNEAVPNDMLNDVIDVIKKCQSTNEPPPAEAQEGDEGKPPDDADSGSG